MSPTLSHLSVRGVTVPHTITEIGFIVSFGSSDIPLSHWLGAICLSEKPGPITGPVGCRHSRHRTWTTVVIEESVGAHGTPGRRAHSHGRPWRRASSTGRHSTPLHQSRCGGAGVGGQQRSTGTCSTGHLTIIVGWGKLFQKHIHYKQSMYLVVVTSTISRFYHHDLALQWLWRVSRILIGFNHT